MLYIELDGKNYQIKRNQLNLTARMKESFIKETLEQYFKLEPNRLDRYRVKHGDEGEIVVEKSGSHSCCHAC